MNKIFVNLATLGVGLFALSAPAMAANWVQVSESSTGSIGYIDTESLTSDGSATIKVWRKWDRSRDKTRPERTSLEYWTINCADRTMGVISYADYDADGGVIKSHKFNYVRSEPVVPDSVGESTMKAACIIAGKTGAP